MTIFLVLMSFLDGIVDHDLEVIGVGISGHQASPASLIVSVVERVGFT